MKNLIIYTFIFIFKTMYRSFLFASQIFFQILYILSFKAVQEIKQVRKTSWYYTDFETHYTVEQLTRLACLIPFDLPLTYWKVSLFFEGRLSKNLCYKVIEIAEIERGTRAPVYETQNKTKFPLLNKILWKIMEKEAKQRKEIENSLQISH